MDAGTGKLAMQWISYYSCVDELILKRLPFNEIRAQIHILKKKKANPKRHSLNQSASRLAQAPAAIIEDGRLWRRLRKQGRDVTPWPHSSSSSRGPIVLQVHIRLSFICGLHVVWNCVWDELNYYVILAEFLLHGRGASGNSDRYERLMRTAKGLRPGCRRHLHPACLVMLIDPDGIQQTTHCTPCPWSSS